MSEKIARLSGHYIVCGFGRLGERIVQDLDSRGESLVVVEWSVAAGERLLAQQILRTKAVLPGTTVSRTVRLQYHAWPWTHSDFDLHDVAGIYRLVRPVYWRFDPPDQPDHRGEMRPLEPAVSQPFRVAVP